MHIHKILAFLPWFTQCTHTLLDWQSKKKIYSSTTYHTQQLVLPEAGPGEPIMSTSCGTSSSRRTKPAITPFKVRQKCQAQHWGVGLGSCTRGSGAAENCA